ncbi:hypothetical protein [Novosphingobium mathurense]|uniref:Uncharacterized protein n=1 Tax=Novosphingobium mathurense TaxID=428990 RepID=A0A1U6IEW2_9SPHN|nr:hypothetical protein [Novosphingobium mathurense]SLK06556.1 hypothetical protein SAMN06295987_1068 [Novosphingobium mathurense]
MSAPQHFPVQDCTEVDLMWDARRGLVFLEHDSECAALAAKLAARTARHRFLFPLCLLGAAVFGASCVLAQAMKWIAL